MDKQTSITTLDTSIFLKEGAFVRWKGMWYIFQGPFEVPEKLDSQVFSISCADFYGYNKGCFRASLITSIDSATWQKHFKSELRSISRAWTQPSREFYSQSFQAIQNKIRLGEWKKAVPIAFTRSQGSLGFDEKIFILSQLTHTHETLIPYGFWKDGHGMIGLTPEILFWRQGKRLSTMALAGTERKNSQECNLLKDEKNIKEHNFVVQELHEKLNFLGQVNLTGPEILELPTLFHLLTRFDVQLQKTWDDLREIEHFHPTSALGISPYHKWKELEQLPEQKVRNYFGSPLLFKIAEDESLALVALRQIQWNSSEVLIGAGGGVVQESQEELEWQEILAKIESVKKLMGIS